MAVPTDAPMPPGLDLPDGYIVQFAALDPSTGAAVSNVTVSNVSIFGTILGSAASAQSVYKPVLLRTAASGG